MKKMFLAALVSGMMVSSVSFAQDKPEVSVGADLVSSYIWRGQDLGNAAIQPSLGVAYKGISLSAWGSYGITQASDTKELDFTLSYSAGAFTVGATDYYCLPAGVYETAKYFEYKAHDTKHVFEAFVGYDFGVASITWYTNFAGADGLNKDGKRAYTSYVEASAPFKLGGVDCSFTAGAVPYASSFYADVNGFAVTNLKLSASKELTVTPTFKLPLSASITANPATSKLYMTVGVSF